jgi:hypothetical protein
MARSKNERDDGTAAVPVTADNPDVSEQGTDPEVADASEVSTKRTVKDSEPLKESDWVDQPVERPYDEAVTDEHREFLRTFGKDPKEA